MSRLRFDMVATDEKDPEGPPPDQVARWLHLKEQHPDARYSVIRDSGPGSSSERGSFSGAFRRADRDIVASSLESLINKLLAREAGRPAG